MRQYTHLTEHERYHIWLMIGQQDSLTSIANRMGRSVSTISREIKRNTGKKGYRYQQAGRFAHASHQTKNKHIKLTPQVIRYVKDNLKQYWCPEQVANRLYCDWDISISTETIYRFVLKNKMAGSNLYKYLRCQSRPYRKRYGKPDYRGKIPKQSGYS